jgi:hypothetical protein
LNSLRRKIKDTSKHEARQKHAPLEVGGYAFAILDNLDWVLDLVANDTIASTSAAVIKNLSSEQATLLSLFARAPKLEVIIGRIV